MWMPWLSSQSPLELAQFYPNFILKILSLDFWGQLYCNKFHSKSPCKFTICSWARQSPDSLPAIIPCPAMLPVLLRLLNEKWTIALVTQCSAQSCARDIYCIQTRHRMHWCSLTKGALINWQVNTQYCCVYPCSHHYICITSMLWSARL